MAELVRRRHSSPVEKKDGRVRTSTWRLAPRNSSRGQIEDRGEEEKVERIFGFLHKINFSPELKVDDLKIPCKVNNPILIKEINYFEGYPVFTANPIAIQKK